MGRIARVLESKVNSDGFLILKVEVDYKNNKQIELYSSPGDCSRPLAEDKILIIEKEGTGEYAGIAILNEDQSEDEGEKKLFSRDANGNIKASVYFKKDGKLIIDCDSDIEIKSDSKIKMMNGSDFAVRYLELKTQLDQLKSDFNNHIHTNASSGFSFTTPVGGGNVSGSSGSPTVPSSADFSNCKVTDINVPSKTED